jgi:DNA-binding CsgD family transcriptional regulator
MVYLKDRHLLDFLGLDQETTAVYEALLTADAGPAAVSAITGLAESNVHAALAALAEMGLVRRPARGSDDWCAIRPELAFAALVHQHEADMARKYQQLAAAAAAATTVWSARLQHSAGTFEPLQGCADALAEASRLAAQATNEYSLVTPAARRALTALHTNPSALEAAVARGVSVRTLFHDSIRSDRAALPVARRLAVVGAHVRTAPIPPLPLVICDRQVALIPGGQARREAALIIREPAIVAPLLAIFEHSWDAAIPLGARTTPNGRTGPTAAERALLQLLAAGLTDEAAAKRLGVSERTAQRHLKTAMIKLQATSRFQAGHNAAQRGWLSATPDHGNNGRTDQELSRRPGIEHANSVPHPEWAQ